MSCERHNRIVTVVERAIVMGDYAGMERVDNRSRWNMDDEPANTQISRITYFDSTDWQAGGKNPFRAKIEARLEQMRTEPPRLIDVV